MALLSAVNAYLLPQHLSLDKQVDSSLWVEMSIKLDNISII